MLLLHSLVVVMVRNQCEYHRQVDLCIWAYEYIHVHRVVSCNAQSALKVRQPRKIPLIALNARKSLNKQSPLEDTVYSIVLQFHFISSQLNRRTRTMAPQRWAASLDMYRKVPMDLLEGTKRGSVLSYMALIVMLTLFIFETKAYFHSR